MNIILTHLPFRDWCPYCAQRKEVSAAHNRGNIEESQVPVIAMDCIDLNRSEPGEGKNPIIVMVDRKTNMKYANGIKNKGDQDHYRIESVALDIVRNRGVRAFCL